VAGGEKVDLLFKERLRRFDLTQGSIGHEVLVNRPRFSSSRSALLQKNMGGSVNRTGRTKPFSDLPLHPG
jgi:hypothetical protein